MFSAVQTYLLATLPGASYWLNAHYLFAAVLSKNKKDACWRRCCIPDNFYQFNYICYARKRKHFFISEIFSIIFNLNATLPVALVLRSKVLL